MGKGSDAKKPRVAADRAADAGTPWLVAEFVPLNRRRVQGDPPLSFEEFERLIQLRQLLESVMGTKRPLMGSARQALRVPADLEVMYQSDAQGGGKANAANLSDLGAFIRTPHPLEAGTLLRIEFQPRDGTQPVQLEALVRWSSGSGAEGSEGMGVRFENLGPEEKEAILQLVERLLHERTKS